MKIRTVSLACLVLITLPVLPAASSATADELWSRITALQKAPPPQAERENGVAILTRGYVEELARQGTVLSDALLEFIDRYATDPRRWDAIAALTRTYRPVIKEFGDLRAKGWAAVIEDPAAKEAWNRKVNALVQQLIAAKDAPLADRQAGYEQWVDFSRSEVDDAIGSQKAVALAEFRRRIDTMLAGIPDYPSRNRLERQYLYRLRAINPAGVEAYLTALTRDANAATAAWAAGGLATERLRVGPMELAFTAVDGRSVDVSKLRGKVVLVDFWATWCGPCVAQLPNIIANYQKYHDKGFEVIGVALENAGFGPKDTPEQVAAKLVAARKGLTAFTGKRGMPWPQYCDGKYWKNDLSTKYGIIGIPTMFLLDQRGRLVTDDARGPRLEAEIRRLLKL